MYHEQRELIPFLMIYSIFVVVLLAREYMYHEQKELIPFRMINSIFV
jgi:hypothetical protein